MTTHPHVSVLARYAGNDPGIDEVTAWSVEAHLDSCAGCRARVADSADDGLRALLERIAGEVDRGIAAGPPPVRAQRRWSAVRRRWLLWALLPWLVMSVATLGMAYLLDQVMPALPSLVLLLAPLAPLPGVAVAWSRRADPAWELVAVTPAAGLTMLLRRTAVVLAVMVPALALAGVGTPASLALMLLPALAFTAFTIALGGLLGVRRAAMGVAAVWVAVVVAPSVATAELPILLRPSSVPGWALATVALAAFAATRAGDYRRFSSLN